MKGYDFSMSQNWNIRLLYCVHSEVAQFLLLVAVNRIVVPALTKCAVVLVIQMWCRDLAFHCNSLCCPASCKWLQKLLFHDPFGSKTVHHPGSNSDICGSPSSVTPVCLNTNLDISHLLPKARYQAFPVTGGALSSQKTGRPISEYL